jgi:hypothetical protein
VRRGSGDGGASVSGIEPESFASDYRLIRVVGLVR